MFKPTVDWSYFRFLRSFPTEIILISLSGDIEASLFSTCMPEAVAPQYLVTPDKHKTLNLKVVRFLKIQLVYIYLVNNNALYVRLII